LELKVRNCDSSDQENDDGPSVPDFQEQDSVASSADLLERFANASIAAESQQSQEKGLSPDEWKGAMEKMYSSFTKAMSENTQADPRTVLTQNEWGRSISKQLQEEFLQRWANESGTSTIPKGVLTSRPTTKTMPVSSQNSFEDSIENTCKVSRSKRPLRCVVEASDSDNRRARRKSQKT